MLDDQLYKAITAIKVIMTTMAIIPITAITIKKATTTMTVIALGQAIML